LGSPRMKKQKRFQTLSQATVSGVNILSVLWRRAALLERNTDAGKCHIYRQPPAKALTVKQGVPAAGLEEDGEGSAPSSSAAPDGWVWEIEQFAEQFAQSSAGAVYSPEEKLLVAEEPPAAAVAAPPSDAAARA